MDASARERFDALVDRLRGSMLDRMSKGLSDAVKGMKPEDLAAQRAMVQDLNRLLSKRLSGDEPSRAEVDEFLAQHGDFFPGAATLDDVVEQLAERMAAMQSLLRSLSPEQRAELQDTIDALLRDDRLKWDLAQLAANLDQLLPDGLGDRVPIRRGPAAGPRIRARPARPAPGAGPPRGRPRRHRRGRGHRRDRPLRRPRPPGSGCRARPGRAGGPGDPPRGRRLPRSRRRPHGADAARQPADRPEGARRPVRAAAARCVRRPSAGADRPRRRPRGDAQAVRIRRPVPPRPAGDDVERADARGERAVAAGARSGRPPAARRLRGLPDGADDVGLDRPPRGHEPLDAAPGLLPRRQTRRDRARHVDPDAVPARPPRHRRLRLLRPRAPARGARGARLEQRTSTAPTSSTGCCWPARSSPDTTRRTARSW